MAEKDQLRRRNERLKEEAQRYRTALLQIKQWDVLNPPQTGLMSDLPWLKKLVESLAKRRILSTPTVMVWADSLERIGMHDLLDEAVNGEWYETHAGKQSEEWVETMAEVRIVLADYIKSLPPPTPEEEEIKEQHAPASAEL